MADDFVTLCTELRKLGATHVKHGDFEASFAGVLSATDLAREQVRERVRDDKAAREKALEQARLKELSRV